MSTGPSKGLASDLSQHTMRLVGYGLLAIFLMALDQRAHYLDRFHATVREFTQPLYLIIDAPIHWAGQLSDWFDRTDELIKTRDRLADQLARQQAQLLRLDALSKENEALRGLLGLSQGLDITYVTARVRQVDLSPFSHRLVIDRGRADGLVPGQAVMDQAGLIGQIDTVSQSASTVILITDPDHALPVRVMRTGLVTLAYGGGLKTDLSLPDLPMNVDLVPGDGLVTSGLGGVFAPGLPVAVINTLTRPEGESFARAEATPLGAHDRAQFVLVLTQSQPPPPVSDGQDGSIQDLPAEPSNG